MNYRLARLRRRLRPPTRADVLIRLPTLGFALVLYVVPLLVAPLRPVAVVGLAGLALAGVGAVTLWSWPITAASCVFLTVYAGAVWLVDGPVSVVGAAGVGLALLFLLRSADLARGARDAAVGAGVVRAEVFRGATVGATTLLATLLATTGAGTLASAVPFALAPFVAAAGAVGVVLALVTAVKRAPR
jgi:hypothetical protein